MFFRAETGVCVGDADAQLFGASDNLLALAGGCR